MSLLERYKIMIRALLISSIVFNSGCTTSYSLKWQEDTYPFYRKFKPVCVVADQRRLDREIGCSILSCTIFELEKHRAFSSIKPVDGDCPIKIVVIRKSMSHFDIEWLPISIFKGLITLGSLGFLPVLMNTADEYEFSIVIEDKEVQQYIYLNKIRVLWWVFNKKEQKQEKINSLRIVINNFMHDVRESGAIPYETSPISQDCEVNF